MPHCAYKVEHLSLQAWTETARLAYRRRDIRQGTSCESSAGTTAKLFLKDLFWLAGMLRPYASVMSETLLADCSCDCAVC